MENSTRHRLSSISHFHFPIFSSFRTVFIEDASHWLEPTHRFGRSHHHHHHRHHHRNHHHSTFLFALLLTYQQSHHASKSICHTRTHMQAYILKQLNSYPRACSETHSFSLHHTHTHTHKLKRIHKANRPTQ